MKALLLGIALTICGCSPKASEGNIDVYDAEHNGHDYIIFENEKVVLSAYYIQKIALNAIVLTKQK